MKLLVCGGRDFQHRPSVWEAIDWLHEGQDGPVTEIIHGDYRGVDDYAKQWAKVHRIAERAFPADWAGLGRAAGPIRNSAMVAYGPDLVLAINGGDGTADTVSKARTEGIRVIEVRFS